MDLAALIESLPGGGVSVLLCVERDPEACHRSIIAARMAARHGLPVTDIRPGAPREPARAPRPSPSR